VTTPLSELQRLLLLRLENTKSRRLGSALFLPYAKDRKRLGIQEGQIQAARGELLQQGLVAERKVGGGLSYQLTTAGAELLRTPQPPPTGYDERLLPYHKAYLLFLLFRTDTRKCSMADLYSRLDTQTAKGLLGFGQQSPDGRILVNRQLVAWTLDGLAATGAVTKKQERGTAFYLLTEVGENLLGDE
jgi:hypothetical protein